jgi:uncharacterized protein
MPTDKIDLGELALSFGEATTVEGLVALGALTLGGQEYHMVPEEIPFRLDVSRASSGHALRLRFEAAVEGPCFRCLDPAEISVAVDAREVDQPDATFDRDDEGPSGEGVEAGSPYVEDGSVLDLAGWARDVLILELPDRILCRPDCPGLCPQCGESLAGADPEEHRHGEQGDPRWAKLRELG